MEIKTKFFGEINIADEQIIIFPYGIYGFEDSTRFVLLHDEEDEEDENNMIFRWLQCLDDENLCFTVMEPKFICKDYNPKLPANALNMLKRIGAEKKSNDLNGKNECSESVESVEIYDAVENANAKANGDGLIYLVIAVIYENIDESTVNLLGPVVINPKSKIGAQIILESSEPQNSEYKIKHRIFKNYDDSTLFTAQDEEYDGYDGYGEYRQDDQTGQTGREQTEKIERKESIEKVTI